MSLCNLAGECQSKSGSARFVGDKWLEDTFHLLRSDSAAGIGTGDGNDISAAGSCQMNGALFGDGFLCIFQQVQDKFLQFDLRMNKFTERVGDRRGKFNICFICVQRDCKRDCNVFQKLFYREDRIIQFIAAVKGRKLF